MQKSGILYIVATPIGNLHDISERALTTLKNVDFIIAEDTRHSKKLLNTYGIDKPLLAFHEHNENIQSATIIVKLRSGQNIALISDAGTPLISDPGYHLVKEAKNNNLTVIPIPGPCALITALSASGLATDSFIFVGFLPTKETQLLKKISELQNETRTMIFYEAPHRALKTMQAMQKIFGATRIGVYARELTKIFETIKKDTLENLVNFIKQDQNQERGEIVILVEGASDTVSSQEESEALRILSILTKELPGSQAVDLALEILNKNLTKKDLYKLMLTLKK